ncbi:MAG: ANTAR domain-containing response regulator [Candidatus Ornithospirochaeta sp.]
MRELVYSTLMVSPNQKLAEFASDLLGQNSFYPVRKVSSVTEARQALSIRQYDVLIVNYPLLDETGVELSMEMSKDCSSVVLLLVPSSSFAEVEAKTRGSGVFLLKKPLSLQTLAQAASWIRSASDRVRSIQSGRVKLEEKIDEIRLVSRAKCILIENLGMSEAEAHKYITKEAMDRCTTKREVAVTILRTWSR